jgi:acetyl esterase/lipase
MRVSSRLSTRILAAGIAASAVIAMFAGCAALSPATKLRDQVSANLHTYPGVTVVHNLAYEKVDNVTEHLDVCLPRVPTTAPLVARPAIIEVHGGSWAYDDETDPDWQDVCQWLASIGYVTANVDYRLAPQYPFPDGIHDVEHAVEWMRQPAQTARFAINPRHIGAFGGSAGGNLVSLLGTLGNGPTSTGHRVAAVAEMSGPINLTSTGVERHHFYIHVRAYLNCTALTSCPQAAAASPDTHIDSTDPPFFVSNSTNELIPLEQSADFVKALQAANVSVSFITLEGQKHSIAGLDAAMRTRIASFFHENIPLPSPATK